MSDKYFTVNIRAYLDKDEPTYIGEESLYDLLSDFSCPQNPDVEYFLLHNAVEFTKKDQSITYLVFDAEDASLVGYFSLTVKPISVRASNISKRQYVKEKKHVWTDLDRIVAPSVLLLNDVQTLHASNNTLQKLYASKEEINGAKEAARKRIECLDDILVRLKQSSFDYNVALMSPPWDQDENGVPTLVKAEIKLAEDRKDLLSFIQLIDLYMY